MRIGIPCSGLVGGMFVARTGHEVVFSSSRNVRRLKSLAWDAAKSASAGMARNAAQNADGLLLAVHWSRLDDVLGQAGDFPGKAT